MEKLFSPWRSQYISSFGATETPTGCVFCAADSGVDDAGSLLVYRGKQCFVLMNRFPYNSGHLMIIPHRHTADYLSLTRAELDDSTLLLQVSIAALTELLHPHGFNIGMNLGRTAGAGIDDHLHWHVVPRWNGDTNFMPVLADVKVVSEDMQLQWQRLNETFPAIVDRFITD